MAENLGEKAKRTKRDIKGGDEVEEGMHTFSLSIVRHTNTYFTLHTNTVTTASLWEGKMC